MSAICGIINLDGEPVDPGAMEKMMAALVHRGPDGSKTIIDGQAGFGFQMFHITPESLTEELPYKGPGSPLLISGDIRLDNRDQLSSALDLCAHGDGLPDSQLVLKAYEKWGTEIGAHLLGDYAIAIWDKNKKELILITDHMGMRPVYYHQSGKRFVFATEIKGVLALPDIPKKLNKELLALQLAVPATPYLVPEQTFFQDVNAMCAASVMRVRAGTTSSKRYWFLDPGRELEFKGEEDWIEAFQELFFKAVSSRLRSHFPVVCLLSGGLDSSSIAGTASAILKKRGKRLHTFSTVLPDAYKGSGSDERWFIDQFKSDDNLDMRYITNEGRGPFDQVEQLVRNGETPFCASAHYIYTAFSCEAQKLGARVVLDGCFGEMGPSSHGDGCLAELLLQGHILKVGKEIFLRSRREGKRMLGVVKGEIIKPLLPYRLQALLAPRFDISQMSKNFPVRNEFIQKWAGNRIRDLEKKGLSLLYTSANHRKNLAGFFNEKRRGFANNGFVGYELIPQCYPLADPRLIEFCLASPLSMKVENGYKRYMIRAGMKGILPPAVRWRTCKEPFSPDYHNRYNNQKHIAVKLFSCINTNDPVGEIIDPDGIKKHLFHHMASARCDTHQGFMTMHVVPRTVYLYHFLRMFDEYRN